jgi:hypothetical protein
MPPLYQQGHRSQPEIRQGRATTTALGFSVNILFLFKNSDDIEGQTVELGSPGGVKVAKTSANSA